MGINTSASPPAITPDDDGLLLGPEGLVAEVAFEEFEGRVADEFHGDRKATRYPAFEDDPQAHSRSEPDECHPAHPPQYPVRPVRRFERWGACHIRSMFMPTYRSIRRSLMHLLLMAWSASAWAQCSNYAISMPDGDGMWRSPGAWWTRMAN